ncbi:Farnesyl pyrophosphate synthetase [Mycoemilia scoparia]|uniref:Farnesyl pyrophosphate synthetase n=1 Tax=Mycoemilia scoparia TaxID=417184 RepID=A0A9W7ZXJ1_9FUNG|nr:Farnesyl pyrophosphate synthetase [Mycoemilia scoparia]
MGATSKQEFIDFFPTLVEDVLGELPSYDCSPESIERLRKVIDYNVAGGKMNRGLSVVDTTRILVGEENFTPEIKRKAFILGWSVEWLQAFFLVADDIMDASITRRGQPAWYRNEGVGLIAINDSFLLEAFIYRLFKKHFKQEPFYVDLLELLQDCTYRTELGQMIDLITAPEDDINLDRFSIEKHAYIVKYKTAYYSFYLPVAMSFLLCGYKAEDPIFKQAEEFLIPLGEYFQIQDDYLDCYGDPEHIGKIGTDIEDNKCSWMVVQALDAIARSGSKEQRQILEDNYGRKDQEKAAKVKALYRDLNIESVYLEYEERVGKNLLDQISEVKDPKLGQVFKAFFDKIYKRSK